MIEEHYEKRKGPDALYDLVCCSESLQAGDEGKIAKCIEMIKPGGYFFFSMI